MSYSLMKVWTDNVMDKVFIDELECFGYHGVFEEEKKKGQPFIISAIIHLDSSDAASKDDCNLTVNYASVCQDIEDIVSKGSFDLIETLAKKIAETIIFKYNRVERIEIRVDKPKAPIELKFKSIAVSTDIRWHRAYIALGANIGDPEGNIRGAVKEFLHDERFKNLRESKLIRTKPYGGIDQPDFLNGAIEVKTILTPSELLKYTSSIENKFERKRDMHWGPRTLDLDIIFYDDEIIDTKDLIIPHPEMHKRDFVLEPIAMLNPNLVHPIYRMRISEMLDELREKESKYVKC